ncbi:iron-sulfur cluster assembly accessory protein [Pirellula staleyi DSM 6068]|uniref:Iron-sulfur cluster assembly accessory protein n=1 Tax=Pirellula staleyi (strain ATCC 27377 / DSM 6068 / ICPB 4128) TaxID=530564 RepID=D2R984_PIRSD|nr:iron-sulfur cluster assembly accessory protein [Pirellula staleyi]ADB17634.1 iron-sulfur cluster assembly accessory protein [Pirellula staleyi DSM 6068]
MTIQMTESAAKEVLKYKENVQAEGETFLRVKIVAGGCSGHTPSLTLDKNFDEMKDSKYNYFGVDLVVDKKSELYLDDATVNFINGLEHSGFHIDIPSAKKSCGCGSSYQF